jgi:hypothetical protein
MARVKAGDKVGAEADITAVKTLDSDIEEGIRAQRWRRCNIRLQKRGNRATLSRGRPNFPS